MLRWVRIAALATPVVPPVYCRKAMSCGPRVTASSFNPRPEPSALLKVTTPGMFQAGICLRTWRSTKFTKAPRGNPNRSPMRVTRTLLRPVCGRTFCTTCAKFSTTTIALAPESLSWCSSSRAVYSGLVFTTTMPARSTPNSAIGYCRTFGIIRATRSPAARPDLCCSQAANARLSSPSWAKLKRRAHIRIRRQIAVGGTGLVEHLGERGIPIGVDIGGYARRVVL